MSDEEKPDPVSVQVGISFEWGFRAGMLRAAAIAQKVAEDWDAHPGGPAFHKEIKANMARFVAASILAQSKPT